MAVDLLSSKPMAIDIYAGKGGWTQGLQAVGYQCIGFDIADMGGYPGELVLQNVRTIHGSQFRNATLIVASPPCTEYSYMAMPWSRAKQIAAALCEEVPFPAGYTGSRNLNELNALFNACFRIQREACEAAGRHIPLVVENVKGAQPWVGPAKAHYGSFYLWGDVGSVGGAIVAGRVQFGSLLRAKRIRKVAGFNFHQFEKTGEPGGSFQSAAVASIKGNGGGWLEGKRNDPRDVRRMPDGSWGIKQNGSGPEWFDTGICKHSSRSAARKEASARIAMIPFDLACYIGRCFQ